MVFKLTIDIGNDAMNDYDDLARALAKLAERMGNGSYRTGRIKYDGGKIMDLNGNSVGLWSIDDNE